MKKHIPNAITLFNLACGCVATVYCLEGKFVYVLMLMGIAMIADFADGLLAKALNARSELGLQLDSLADAVSFGLVPGMILYVLIEDAAGPFINYPEPFLRLEHAGFIFTIFAVLRLGRFNIDVRQKDGFIGLATPAASIFVAGLLMISHFDVAPFASWLDDGILLVSITIALAILMNSNIPMFSFKVKGTRWQGNEARVVFIVLVVLLGILLKWASLPAIIILYMLVSVVEDAVVKGQKKVSTPNDKKVN